MRLDLLEERKGDRMKEIKKIKRLLDDFEITCPFLPKFQIKKSLELKGKYLIQKLELEPNSNQLYSDTIELLIDHKKKGINIDQFGSNILNMLRSGTDSLMIIIGRGIESLLPRCVEFQNFHIDLLNILSELSLNLGVKSKNSLKFSEFITEAINFNATSLSIKPNVMGYFEFIKLSRIQNTDDGDDTLLLESIESCILSIRNGIDPNEDVKGKLQVIKFIIDETGNIRKALDYSIGIFYNCDFDEYGPLIFEELANAIEGREKKERCTKRLSSVADNASSSYDPLSDFLLKFSDYAKIKRNQKVIIETLLRISERNFIIKKDYKRCEEILKIIQSLGIPDAEEDVKIKIIKCYLKMDKLTETKEMINELKEENLEILLENYLRNQDEFNASECIEKILLTKRGRHEIFFSMYSSLKLRLSNEMKMKLLKAAQCEDKDSISIIRGIISILYDCIIESGLIQGYKEEFDFNLKTLQAKPFLPREQIIWTCQVCWNLGVIHARAEDFNNAKFSFKWCYEFSKKLDGEEDIDPIEKNEFIFKSCFYYLTSKLCINHYGESDNCTNEDFEILKLLERSEENKLEVKCLMIEMFLRSKRWGSLEEILKDEDEEVKVSFEIISEIILRSSEELPLNLYKIILENLSVKELESDNFDMKRFSDLYRGLTACSLLQYPNDMSHFNSIIKIIKNSFGRYPADEIIWYCGTSLEMSRKAAEMKHEWNLAGEWIEISLSLVYLIPEDDDRLRILKSSLQASVKQKKNKKKALIVYVDTTFI